MNLTTRISLLALSLLALASAPALADNKNDEAMKSIAAKAGCVTCHAIESGAKGPDGLSPIGPPWTDVAIRYKGDKAAQKRLLDEVMLGTSPYLRHWAGKASGVAMPPNAVAISEPDAKKLVNWILKLAK